MQDLTYSAQEMMMKLRKGASASLNSTKLAEVFAYLPGWKIEKAKFQKPSRGGWKTKEIPGGAEFHRSYVSSPDGRIHFDAEVLIGECAGWYAETGRAQDQAKVTLLCDVIFPQLQALAASPNNKSKWTIVDPTITETKSEGGEGSDNYREGVDVSFEFIVEASGFVITSPDGQTYEVFGDYKNGAINATTFDSFYKWAVEETNIEQEILDVLGMEAIVKKEDIKAPYTPPRGAHAAELKVFALLVEMTNGVKEAMREQQTAVMYSDVATYQRLIAEGKDEAALALSYRLSGCIDKNKQVIAAADLDERIAKMVDADVTGMQNMFVRKNTRKLAPILSAKNVDFTPEVVYITASRGVIESRIKFVFEDDSRFSVKNQVVRSWTQSRFGYTEFYRFPTTFSDIFLKDGTKVANPCEEAMNEVFAKN